MKKVFLIFSFICSLFLVVGCASTDNATDTAPEETKAPNSNLVVNYDIVSDSTIVEHKDLQFKPHLTCNVYDNPWNGQRVNIRVVLENNVPNIYIYYQVAKNFKINSVLFVDTNANKRVEIKDGTLDLENFQGLNRNKYKVALNQEQTETLKEILKGTPQIIFLDGLEKTDFFDIDNDISDAILEVLNYTPEQTE